eukprot:2054895-Pyramimonas_sp.AAC.1
MPYAPLTDFAYAEALPPPPAREPGNGTGDNGGNTDGGDDDDEVYVMVALGVGGLVLNLLLFGGMYKLYIYWAALSKATPKAPGYAKVAPAPQEAPAARTETASSIEDEALEEGLEVVVAHPIERSVAESSRGPDNSRI